MAGRTLRPEFTRSLVWRYIHHIRNAINTRIVKVKWSVRTVTPLNSLVELKFVNNVREKNETIHFCSELMNTGASGDALANACRAPMPTPR